MSQSLAKIYTHIVLSTKHRYPFLADESVRTEMHAYLAGSCNNLKCPAIIVGGVADHVHILCVLSRNFSVADLVGEIKRSSSKWVKTKGILLCKFAWQNGYGAFSVSQSQVESVRTYIAAQEEHHRKKSFQNEFRSFLEKYRVEFDERYVWD
jgi:REP-associated tyrosine transposase